MSLDNWDRIFRTIILGVVALLSIPSTSAKPISGLARSFSPQLIPVNTPHRAFQNNRQPGTLVKRDTNTWSGIAVFLGTKDGYEHYAFGPFDTNGRLISQEGILVYSQDDRLGGGSYGGIYTSELYELNTPRPPNQLTADTEGLNEDDRVNLKITDGRDGFYGAYVQYKLEHGCGDGAYYIARVQNNLFEPPNNDVPNGQSLVVMEDLFKDCEELLDEYGTMKMNGDTSSWVMDPLVMMRHAARGTKHMHDNGIIHLDLKPNNIMLKYDPAEDDSEEYIIYKIIDFDSAIDVAQRMANGGPWEYATTANYQPPGKFAVMRTSHICELTLPNLETRQDRTKVREWPYKYDVYSLGVTLFEAACPGLLHNDEKWDYVGEIGDEMRSPEDVTSFLEDVLDLDTEAHPTFFDILSWTLCEPAQRYDIATFLHRLENDLTEIPFIVV